MQNIEVIDISKIYSSAGTLVEALVDVTLTVEPQDVYGIIGLSGAGKSTLLRCMAGLIRPSSGKVLMDGLNLAFPNKKKQRDFRYKMGMIFQHFNLLSSRTVAGNIAYPLEVAQILPKKREERVDELLKLVGLSEKKEVYPAFLSGGEKQRVGIARALANAPDILFCDEATSALDPKTTREILDLLRSINKNLGVTMILITHEMGVVKHICNKVAVMEKGQIVEEGLVSEVFADPQHATTKQFLHHSTE